MRLKIIYRCSAAEAGQDPGVIKPKDGDLIMLVVRRPALEGKSAVSH
jgi:hypothetical protein